MRGVCLHSSTQRYVDSPHQVRLRECSRQSQDTPKGSWSPLGPPGEAGEPPCRKRVQVEKFLNLFSVGMHTKRHRSYTQCGITERILFIMKAL